MEIDRVFFLNQFVLPAICFGLSYITGELVQNQGIKVNYTRKINHFALFFLPILPGLVFVYDKSPATKVLGLIISISTLVVIIQPLRDWSAIIRTMFLGFDRPEDRPHTLRWLASHYIAFTLPGWHPMSAAVGARPDLCG